MISAGVGLKKKRILSRAGAKVDVVISLKVGESRAVSVVLRSRKENANACDVIERAMER